MYAPVPAPGQVVQVRQRRWLVDEVVPARSMFESALVRLSCLDDDAAGEGASLLWSHELDARIEPDQPEFVSDGAEIDPPERFGAYLHALRWHTVTSTDKRLLQAPFRAGIDLKAYQLEPLRKALDLPRVNVFIADDVGLGKTIEAGLVLQELLLRQRIDRVLVVCPPQVVVQWQEELEQRFGLSFAIYDREYVTARRRERGFAVNPWTTHPRFVVSYARLRGSRGREGNRHHELLLSALGDRAERSLLILDECHQVAPSTGSVYPADSRTTRAIREIAGRFEHRLFLSATPHNGHSSSFASLLHLLDAQRFTPGVPVQSARELAPVMVRRLKRHLREQVAGLPRRILVDHVVDVPSDAPELRLGKLLAQYDKLYRAAMGDLPPKEQAARALVMVNLHKRLLSSVAAFAHTLQAHARGATAALRDRPQLSLGRRADDEAEVDETTAEEELHSQLQAASFDAGDEARRLLNEMAQLAAAHKDRPDGRVRALADWINEHACPGGRWNETRILVFTEYQHTLSWLRRSLIPLLRGDPTDRIETFTGALGDARREELKRAFNAAPSAFPLRILLCTDAAREGINLQAHCQHLFHFDLPWNPSRIEQRNGRIDRVLQPADEVYCRYFVLPARPEDRVLDHLVRKMHVIREELGSLSEVISAKLEKWLEGGLRTADLSEVDRLTEPERAALAARAELEGEGSEQLRGDLDTLQRQLERSQKAVGFRVEHLEALVDVGLRMASVDGRGLIPVQPATSPPTFTLPPLDASWAGVLQPMRGLPPAGASPRDLPPVRPVAFRAAHRLDAEAVQLHLGHPLVKRLVARFRAQGFAAHDLSRVTALRNPRDSSRRVVLWGRLALFGHGATRLHEQILEVAGRISAEGELEVQKSPRTTVEWLEEALAHGPEPLSDRALRPFRGRAGRDARALWAAMAQAGAEAEKQARERLAERARDEGLAMRELLERQRVRIREAMAVHDSPQGVLLRSKAEVFEREQFERDRRAMNGRLTAIDAEIQTEPEAIRRAYEVVLRRFEPVGMAYLAPEST